LFSDNRDAKPAYQDRLVRAPDGSRLKLLVEREITGQNNETNQ